MWKNFFVIFLFFLCGCVKNGSVYDNATINYPVTGINKVDSEISSYVNNVYSEFVRNKKKSDKLNISYKYKDLNENIINVALNVEIKSSNILHKIKTYTYDKKNDSFLSAEDLIFDLDNLDLDIKKMLLEKYEEVDFEFLNSVKVSEFSFDDDNVTLFFNSKVVKGNNDIVYLDIPLDSLDMMIDLKDDLYFSLKKRNVGYDDKVVALTFDDGPSKYTGGVLDVLKDYDACGTFFVVGSRAYFQGDTLRRILNEGSEIGNHSFDHKVLTSLSDDEFKDEIVKTQEVIHNLTGFTPSLFRPTYGGYTNRLKGLTDLTFVLWDVDSRDWQVKKKDKIISNVLPNIKSGSIVLFHDNHDYALNALSDIIKILKDDGYKFVTVSELLEHKKLWENS